MLIRDTCWDSEGPVRHLGVGHPEDPVRKATEGFVFLGDTSKNDIQRAGCKEDPVKRSTLTKKWGIIMILTNIVACARYSAYLHTEEV